MRTVTDVDGLNGDGVGGGLFRRDKYTIQRRKVGFRLCLGTSYQGTCLGVADPEEYLPGKKV